MQALPITFILHQLHLFLMHLLKDHLDVVEKLVKRDINIIHLGLIQFFILVLCFCLSPSFDITSTSFSPYILHFLKKFFSQLKFPSLNSSQVLSYISLFPYFLPFRKEQASQGHQPHKAYQVTLRLGPSHHIEAG